MAADFLRLQDLWLRVQGSPNSPSSTLTHTAPRSRLGLHALQRQSWLMLAEHSQI